MDWKKLKDWLPRYWLVALALVAGVVLLVVLLGKVWEFANYSWYAVPYRYQIDYDEGINLHAALFVSQGHSPYTPLDPNRFVSAPYPPLFYLLVAIPLHWTGPAFWWGRLVSLLATLGIAALIGAMASRATRWWPIGVLWAVSFLALAPVYVWGPLYKNDMPAIFFTVAGLYVVQRWAGRRAVYWAAPLFAAAAFCKQTALIGPVVGALYLLLHDAQVTPGGLRKWAAWRRAIALGLLSVAAILGPFLLLDSLLHHRLYLHVVTYQQLPWHLSQLVQNLNRMATTYPYLLGLALFSFFYLLLRRKNLLYPLYFLVTTGAMLISNGYEGGNFNHLLDFFPPFCLLCAALLGDLWAERRRLLAQIGLVGAMAVLLWQGLHTFPPTSWYRGLPSSEEATQMERIQKVIADTPGPIFSEDVGILLLSGREVEYDDPSTFSPLARAGIWDERVLEEKFSSRYFNLLLLEYDITNISGGLRWTNRLFQAMKDHYRLLYADWLYIYVPRPGP